MKKTERVKIVTGLKCNIKCIFCYYRNHLKAPNRPFREIISDIVYAKRNGISEVDFSGGEPTIHPDLPMLISEAKSLGMKNICIITNGLRAADLTYLKILKKAGLDEILFSVHGPNEKIHDEITETKGSFSKILEALSNAASENLKIRINTVVNRLNYNYLDAIGTLVLKFRPIQVNFITINDWCFAKHLVDRLMLRYSEMAPKLKSVCNMLEKQVLAVNVRYIPFCFMKGYERFVCNHRQTQFDLFEWVPRVRARLEIENSLLRYLGILLYGFLRGGLLRKIYCMPLADLLDESVIQTSRYRGYKKHPILCKQCCCSEICDGVENTYARKFGMDELASYSGIKIKNPLYFKEKKALLLTNDT